MNIAIDIRCLTQEKKTGVGEYTDELLTTLFEVDNTHNYVLFYNSHKSLPTYLKKWQAPHVTYVVSKLPNKLFNLLIFLRLIRIDSFIQKRTGKHIDYFFAPNINFIHLSKHVRFLLTVHDLSFEFFPHFFTRKQRLWHRLLNPQKLIERAYIILTPSRSTKNDLVDYYHVNKDDIKVIYPGLSSSFSLDNYDDQKAALVKMKYELPDKYIFFLGALEPRKNLSVLLQAYKKSYSIKDGYQLIIAGARGWNNKDIFEDIYKTNGVRYIGYVGQEEKKYLYELASLFVYPSLYEGFGFPVLEAALSGVPVITSNRSSLPELYETGDIHLINPNNIRELANKMVSILKSNNKKPYHEKQKFTKFNWYKSVEQFLQIL